MLFSKLFLLNAALATATTFQAFDSSDCTFGAGSKITVPAGGTCSKTTNRHSFKVEGDSARIGIFDKEGCGANLAYQKYTVQYDQCNPVNTGRAWASTCVIGINNLASSGSCSDV